MKDRRCSPGSLVEYGLGLPGGDGSVGQMLCARKKTPQAGGNAVSRYFLDRRMARENAVDTGKLSLVASSTRNVVIIKDADNRIEWVNDSFTRHYGYSLKECRGQYGDALLGSTDILPGKVAAGMGGALVGAIGGEIVGAVVENAATRHQRAEVLRSGKDGRQRWLSLERRPIVDDVGRITGIIEIESDITEFRQSETESLQARRAAEAANLAKSEFLATMCHEIRNPVTVMIGVMELIMQTGPTAEQREYLSLMKTSCGSLLNIINDSLDLARIEAGCLEAEDLPFSLRDSLGEAVKMLAFEARKKSLAFAYDVAPDVPDALRGDPMRLRQIVINLVSNAIKFTEQGDVVLRVECQDSDDDGVVCRFAISDSGPGVPEEQQARIFEPFLQAEASISRRYGGSGLGLSISARLVRMMNGTIWLESAPAPAIGSTFFFTARFGRQAERPAQCDATDFKGLLALVVESHPVHRSFLVNTLHQWNIEAHATDSGETALQMIARAEAAQRPYRLVLLNDALGGADGQPVAAQLRQSYPAATGRVVLLGSSSSWMGDRQHCAGAARFSCLTLPVKQAELLAVITAATCPLTETCSLMHVQQAGQASGSAAETSALNLTILLVDDNPLNRRLAQLVLEKAGCRLLLADGAAGALEILEYARPDLVLMDVHMPKMDGAATTRAIRQKEAISGGHIPVIALTASVTADDREYCRQAGMDGCLSKPIRPASLLDMLERLQTAPAGQADLMPRNDQVLDRRALLISVNGDRQLLGEIVTLFVDNCSKLMSQARVTIDQRDTDGFSHVLHTLRGMFQTLFAEAAQETAGQLQAVPVEQEPDRAAALYARLEREVAVLKAELVSLNSTTRTRQGVGKPAHQRSLMNGNGRKTGGLPTAALAGVKAWSLRAGACKPRTLSKNHVAGRHQG